MRVTGEAFVNTLTERNHEQKKRTDIETRQHFGQTVLKAIEYAETLHGYVDPENPVYDQN